MATRRRSIQSTDVEASQVKSYPSTTAGLRSTFDRLPYGCLLFMYRLDLERQGEEHFGVYLPRPFDFRGDGGGSGSLEISV